MNNIIKLFSSKLGEEVLEEWEEEYANPTYRPGEPTEDMVYREGRRSFYLDIRNMVRQHERQRRKQ